MNLGCIFTSQSCSEGKKGAKKRDDHTKFLVPFLNLDMVPRNSVQGSPAFYRETG